MSASPRVIAGRFGSINARTKYRNVRTKVGERTFHSKKEAARYEQLLLLVRNGEVRDLLLQVPFRLEVNGKLICKYFADFVYVERRGDVWREVVEDVKGYRDKIYMLKKKLMLACHNVEIRET